METARSCNRRPALRTHADTVRLPPSPHRGYGAQARRTLRTNADTVWLTFPPKRPEGGSWPPRTTRRQPAERPRATTRRTPRVTLEALKREPQAADRVDRDCHADDGLTRTFCVLGPASEAAESTRAPKIMPQAAFFHATFVATATEVSRPAFAGPPKEADSYRFSRISSKNFTARASCDWPSQNIACLRTTGIRLLRATSISFGMPSSFGI
jgi:hypothetical protein